MQARQAPDKFTHRHLLQADTASQFIFWGLHAHGSTTIDLSFLPIIHLEYSEPYAGLST